MYRISDPLDTGRMRDLQPFVERQPAKETDMSTISIIGSGGIAGAIGGLAIKVGHTVQVSSRDVAKARVLVEQLGTGATTGTFGAAPAGDIAILAVLYSAVLDVVEHHGRKLGSKVLVDITNSVAPDLTAMVTPENSSGAQEIAKAAPANAFVVKAFNTQFSRVLAAGPVEGQPLDVFLAGDVASARTVVSTFVGSLGLRSFDTGPL
jgi:predicted dinucleotide-binding enzyme